MMNSKKDEEPFGLSQEVIEKITSVFNYIPNLEEVIIFGSRAKGNFSLGSDVDLAVTGSHLTWQDLMDLRIGVENLGLLYTFDIHNLDRIGNKDVKSHIARVGKTLWTRQPAAKPA